MADDRWVVVGMRTVTDNVRLERGGGLTSGYLPGGMFTIRIEKIRAMPSFAAYPFMFFLDTALV
ncbi:hypothetical protein AA0243_3094 [Novacetimonas hansenii NRIC 0243]|nr:hypothetical protein AA0243_3094 [Novacetimonas hansenii NRIC 0243]